MRIACSEYTALAETAVVYLSALDIEKRVSAQPTANPFHKQGRLFVSFHIVDKGREDSKRHKV